MRRLVALLVAGSLLFGAATVLAQGRITRTKDGALVEHLDLGTTVIDGELRTPTVQYHDVREKIRFDRLMKLRKSFMPALMESGTDQVFK